MASHNYFTRSKLKRAKLVASEDRISELPSEVIAHILSFLPTRDAIRTSVLSSRWRFLWTSRTNFDFEDFDCRDPFDLRANYHQALASFRTFVHHVLHLCDDSKTIHSFSLSCYWLEDISAINTWINFAVSRNVSELSLFASRFCSYSISKPLLKCTLTCNNLVTLLLKTRFDIDIPASVGSFPHLKELSLVGAYPNDLKVTTRLLNMCPVLEKLLLRGEMKHDKPISLDIFVPTLKRLTITLSLNRDGIFQNEITIRTPKLQSLGIKDNFVARYRVSCPSTIDEADIDVGYGYHTYEDHERIIALSRLHLLFTAISKAKSLLLSSHTMAVLDTTDNDLPVFPSLRTLKLQAFGCFSWRLLFHFLETSPDLEVLVLNQRPRSGGVFDSIDEDSTWIPPDSVPNALSLSLKTIYFKHFIGRKDQYDFMKYLFENGHMLELFKLYSCRDNYCRDMDMDMDMSKLKRCPKAGIRSVSVKKLVKESKRLTNECCVVEVSECCDCLDIHD